MKKIFLSLFVIVVSIQYSLSHRASIASTYPSENISSPSNQNDTTLVVDSIYTPTSTSPVEETPPVEETTTTQVSPAPPSPEESTLTPTPTTETSTSPQDTQPPANQGQYIDGVYTGKPANAYYGIVQVEATIVQGRLDSVSFLQHPTSRRTSERINAIAMPRLEKEAIQAQNADVSGVSGASYTSRAFRQSLGDALSRAKNI